MTRSIGHGSRLTSVRASGGSSHANHAVDVGDPRGRTHRLVFRRWARPDWLITDPDFTARREMAALALLATSGIPAPEVVAADPDAKECDVPAILMARLPRHRPRARGDVVAFLAQLGEALIRIHAVNGGAREVIPSYRTHNDLRAPRPPGWSQRPRLWERAFEAVADAPRERATFIHRDYHPGNTLWAGGRLTGSVDWTAASWGPPGVDLGHMRWNLAMDFGLEAAEEFLSLYLSMAGRASPSLLGHRHRGRSPAGLGSRGASLGPSAAAV